MREARVDRMGPVGVEQERRGAAVGEAEAVARRPLAVGHRSAVEPGVGGVEHRPRLGHAVGIAVGLGADGSNTIFCCGVDT